tara:strand:+ start:502 stop:1065 length:564 start_codon:yes stop_codon:yes gene_type:complete
MKLEIDLNKLKRSFLSPNQYILLYLIYYKEFERIKELFTKVEATLIRDSLVGTKYILSQTNTKFSDTILSISNVGKLLDIRSDQISFVEFYSIYPMKVGSRILRAGSVDTVLGQKHEKKYLSKVKTIDAHREIVASTEAFVAKQRVSGKLPYLPAMETVLNNAMWEQWVTFVQHSGEEGANWHEDSI